MIPKNSETLSAIFVYYRLSHLLKTHWMTWLSLIQSRLGGGKQQYCEIAIPKQTRLFGKKEYKIVI